MKVLFVTEDLANGGSERVISVLANGFTEKHESAVVAIRRDLVKYTLNDKVEYYPFLQDDAGKFTRTVGRVLHLIKTIRKYRPQVVVAFDVIPVVYAFIACWICGVKLVVSERADPKKHENKGNTGKLYFRAFEHANGAVFQTKDAQSYYSSHVQKKSIIIPNPINEEFVVDRYSGERDNEIVTACRLTKQKNLHLFIDIVAEVTAKHPMYKGIIYGDGPELDNLQEYAHEKNVQDVIVFAGRVNNIRERIFKSRFYLCTSDFEGISNSMLEAMALGLNVISTDCPVGGARMAITSGIDGMLFPVSDKTAGVNALEELISDGVRSEKMGIEATKICERWSSRNIVNQWECYLERITLQNSKERYN